MKTAEGLVKWAKQWVGHPYWYGMFGYKASQRYFNDKNKQYPRHYNRPERAIRYKQHIDRGLEVFDCIGLIQGYMWHNGQRIVYNPNTDVNANGMLARSKVKGPISSMPDRPGLLVWFNNHIGVYIGNGEVIEARGFDHGVVQTKLSSRGWRQWMECPYIAYAPQGPELTLEVNNRNIPVDMELYAKDNRSYVTLEGKDGQKHAIHVKELARVLGAGLVWDEPTKTVKLTVR